VLALLGLFFRVGLTEKISNPQSTPANVDPLLALGDIYQVYTQIGVISLNSVAELQLCHYSCHQCSSQDDELLLLSG
jgi:hypothetical protein